MPAPTINPDGRPATEIPLTSTYRPGSPVWVHRAGAWRPGRIEAASALAAMVRYRPTDHHGTAVDTVTSVHLARRVEEDEVDHPLPAAALRPCIAELPRRGGQQ